MEPKTGVQRLTAAVVESPITEGLLRLRPVAWMVRNATRMVVRQQVGKTIVSDLSIEQPAARDIQSTLEAIVRDVVHSYGYVSAMVATLDPGDALTMRAFYVDPQLVSMEQIHEWEQQMSRLTGLNLSFTDPQVARVYRYKPEYQDNLSIKATNLLKPVVSDSLFSLFTSIVPPVGREFIHAIQTEMGIQQVIAVPFFVGDEVVGNLFAIKKDVISEQDQTILAAFGRQAAIALENERRRLQVQVMQELVYKVQANLQDEVLLLEHIVQDVVKYMGYIGAMVATYESDGSLPVKAFYIDPAIADLEKIHVWEHQLSNLLGKPISISDPEIACVYTNDPAYSDNLSIKAARAGEPVISDELFSLFVPIVPDGKLVREVVSAMQAEMGIQQAIAVPFFLGQELVGNLFAATRSRSFSRGEIAVLTTFGQQAAAGIRNARLYRISNERREIAQIFAKMAFSAAASVHDLRNHIGVAKSNIEMFKMFDKLPPEGQKMVIDMIPRAIER
ncbi:MAG: GAF domain-containing protein, partial [Anaerolineae bacterium]|nr:GAF domain-containing protein [Anaerolineae bacterium]